MAKKRAGLKLIGVPVEPETHAAIVALAEENAVDGRPLPLAQLCRHLLHLALERDYGRFVKRDLADAGYQDGLRRGLHEAKTKIAGALKGSW